MNAPNSLSPVISLSSLLRHAMTLVCVPIIGIKLPEPNRKLVLVIILERLVLEPDAEIKLLLPLLRNLLLLLLGAHHSVLVAAHHQLVLAEDDVCILSPAFALRNRILRKSVIYPQLGRASLPPSLGS